MKYYQTHVFRETQREWKKRLKDSGFKDIENDKQHIVGSNLSSDNKKVSKQERFDYFRMIINKLYSDSLVVPPDINPRDLIVMAMRGNGYLLKQIAKENKIDRRTVRFIIRRYEHLWGIRFWTKKQRNLK